MKWNLLWNDIKEECGYILAALCGTLAFFLFVPFAFIYYCLEGPYSVYRDRTICPACHHYLLMPKYHDCKEHNTNLEQHEEMPI
jgi:hypothetical protein